MLGERCNARARVISRCGRPAHCARGLTRPEWLSEGEPWDAAVEEVSAAELVARETTDAQRLAGTALDSIGLVPRLSAARPLDHRRNRRRHESRPMSRGCKRLPTPEQWSASTSSGSCCNRSLSGCRALVAGYTVKREYFNAEFSAGIENISFDALEGFNSPMFLRTVKLKDFPWNGWLQLGLEPRPSAAWNPDRRLHRPVRPPHVVRCRRPGSDTHALRSGLDAQPLLRCRGLATVMLLARQKIRVRIGTPVRPDQVSLPGGRESCAAVPQSCSSLLSHWR